MEQHFRGSQSLLSYISALIGTCSVTDWEIMRPAAVSSFGKAALRTASSASRSTSAHTQQNLAQAISSGRPISSSLRTRRISVAGRTFATAAPAQGAEQLRWKRGAEIRMLYDGDCPLCMREVNMLRRRDEGTGKIDFVDISSPDYEAESNANISYEQAMGEIHAVLPDGSIATNVDVFRRLYEAVGLGWVYAITKVGPIGKVADWVYGIWAKYRLPITGRPDLATVMAEKKSCKIR